MWPMAMLWCTKIMNGSLLIWAVLAVATFWSVGVYNRVMRMRARGLSALGSVEKYMRQYADLVQTHLSDMDAPSQRENAGFRPEPVLWTPLQLRLTTLDGALRDVHVAPLTIQPMHNLGRALEDLQQVWEGMLVDPALPRLNETMGAQWATISIKVQTARGGLNQILTKYNEAIDQFPARLLARLMRFEPAGLL